MNGIFYFSSTGNSLYLSKRIKSKLGGKIIYIPNYQGDASEFEKIIVGSQEEHDRMQANRKNVID